MTSSARARVAQRAALVACLGMLLSSATLTWAAQHGGGQHAAPAPRSQGAAPRGQGQMRQQPARPAGNFAARPQGNFAPRPPAAGNFQPARPPADFGAQRNLPGSVPARPAYNGAPYSVRATPPSTPLQTGHLPQWMAEHGNMPVGQQERLLRQEPGFNRLNPTDQQRLVQQLHQVNQLPEAQRDRRLARAEAIERLSPAERTQVNESARQMATLPPDRQQMVRRAFQDLRGVPVDQRETMLNSARYSAEFSPQERGMLSNLLRVEPYESPR